jgi:hypothetical protein
MGFVISGGWWLLHRWYLSDERHLNSFPQPGNEHLYGVSLEWTRIWFFRLDLSLNIFPQLGCLHEKFETGAQDFFMSCWGPLWKVTSNVLVVQQPAAQHPYVLLESAKALLCPPPKKWDLHLLIKRKYALIGHTCWSNRQDGRFFRIELLLRLGLILWWIDKWKWDVEPHAVQWNLERDFRAIGFSFPAFLAHEGERARNHKKIRKSGSVMLQQNRFRCNGERCRPPPSDPFVLNSARQSHGWSTIDRTTSWPLGVHPAPLPNKRSSPGNQSIAGGIFQGGSGPIVSLAHTADHSGARRTRIVSYC